MRIFVTGASSGIGEALVREYARRDPRAEFGLLARRRERLAALAAEIGPGRARTYAVDVNDRAALHAAARDFVAAGAAPDVVIANAGVSAGTDSLGGGDADAFERIVRTNAIAMYDTLAPFVPAITEARRGRLVGIASVAGIRGLPGAGAYSASKAAAIAYLESLRVELRGTGVAVVTIAPGFVRTPMTAANRYAMPFLTDADAFARRAVAKIDAGASFAVIPWQMRIVAALMRALPDRAYDAAFSRAPRKSRGAGPGRR